MMLATLRSCVALAVLPALLLIAVGATAAEPDLVEQGRRMYVDGVRVSGQLLQATQNGAVKLSGTQAACVGCHRASGMGSVEGSQPVSPIGRRFLFAQEGDLVMANMDGRRGKTLNQTHAPYGDETLALALRQGVGMGGRTLSGVMPHFALDGHDISALKAYLQQLSSDYSPGVNKQTIRFATVITPDVSDARRAIFKAMLQSALVSKNSSTAPRKRYMSSAASFVTQTERRWELQVWELSGAPQTWHAQLQAHYRDWPVFALLSGLSDSSWAPVDAFCQAQQVPCWFPSVGVPSTGDADAPVAYGLYFSRGVTLEAAVLARDLLGAKVNAAPKRLLQLQAGQAGAVAAQAFAQSVRAQGRSVQNLALTADAGETGLRSALQQVRAGDAVALWLDATQLQWLAGMTPPSGVKFYLSSSLTQTSATKQLAPEWRTAVQWVYPYELPHKREANLAYLHSWLKLRDLPLVDEVLQSEVFFALNLMTDTLQDMLDNLYRDYLIERAQDMVSKRESGKAEQESRDRHTLGRAGRTVVNAELVHGAAVADASNAVATQRRAFALGDSTGTSIYPRLSLGPGQRFASKGAYIVHVDADGALVADSDWIVP